MTTGIPIARDSTPAGAAVAHPDDDVGIDFSKPPNGAGAQPPEMEAYYVARSGGERKGPMALTALRDLVHAGELTARDLAWREGMADWIAIGKLPELAGASFPAATQVPAITANSDRNSPNWLRKLLVEPCPVVAIRAIGRFSALLSLLVFAGSTVLWLLNRSWYAGALGYAFLFVACEALALWIERQPVSAAPQPSPETSSGTKHA